LGGAIIMASRPAPNQTAAAVEIHPAPSFVCSIETIIIEGSSRVSLRSPAPLDPQQLSTITPLPLSLQHTAQKSNKQQSQVDALLAIKAAVDKYNNVLSDWSQSNANNYCRWTGVYCENGDVRGLTLAGNGKGGAAPHGKLPPASALRALPRLWALRVDGWGVRSALPAGYGDLSSLGELVLNVDGMGSNVPPQWGNLRSLKRLVLKACNLTGELPAELGNLGSLEELNVTVNALSGQVPAALGRLSALKVLDLSRNSFYGALPASWGALRGLQSLDLSHNSDLHGPIPDAWTGLSSIKTFAAAECNIRGGLPAGVPNAWRSIEQLLLSGNELAGAVPGGWSPSLKVLDLGHNSLSGQLPDKIGGTLKALYLGYNDLEGGVPSSWGFDLKKIETLNLEQNKLSGPLPAQVPAWSGRWPAVRLFLSGNSLSGPLPFEWRTLNPAVVSLRCVFCAFGFWAESNADARIEILCVTISPTLTPHPPSLNR
jgi:Leucine-rich repeat (LRR) protein